MGNKLHLYILIVLAIVVWLGTGVYVASILDTPIEIVKGQRWYVVLPRQSDVSDVYLYSQTEKTVLLEFDDESKLRYAKEDVRFIELVPKQLWTKVYY